MKARLCTAALAAAIVGFSSPVAAQGLAGGIGSLIRLGNCNESLCVTTSTDPNNPHGTHFLSAAQVAGDELLAFLTGSITASVGRLPISSTGGGSTFSFVGGAPVRTNTSAGPIFAERAATLGKGRFLAGLNTTGMSFSELRGIALSDLTFDLAHADVGTPGLGDSPNESDIVRIAMDLDLKLQATTLFASYGLSDRIDVSVALPLVMSSLKGTARGSVYNVTGTVTGNHCFESGGTECTVTQSVDESASGIGDIALRTKIALGGTSTRGLALLGDLRLPTGDEEQFHGSGGLSGSWMLIASTTRGNFSPHANVGVALRTGVAQSNAFVTTVGFDHMVSQAVTVAVDLLSEMQMGDNAVHLPQPIALPIPVRATNIPDQKDNPIGLSLGARMFVGGFTLVGNGLIPVKSAGMQSKFAWTFGVERTF